MLGWVDVWNGGGPGQSHVNVGLDLGLSVCHDKVNGPHVPSKKQSEYEDSANGGPQHDWGEGRPIGIAIYLAVTSCTKTGLPLHDCTRRVTLAAECPHHRYGLCVSWHLGPVDDTHLLEFRVLFELLLHGPNKIVMVWLS